MRARKLGRKLSAEHKKKMSEQLFFKDPKYREKMSIALKKISGTQEARDRLTKISRAQVRTAEHNAKISAAHMGKTMSPEHKEKLRNANVGRKQPQEEIERRGLAIKAAWARKRSSAITQRTVH